MHFSLNSAFNRFFQRACARVFARALTGWVWCLMVGLVLFTGRSMGVESVKSSSAPAAKVDFTEQVRPVLASHCFKCHGQDEGSRKAKLRLDVRENAVKPAESDAVAVVPGKPEKSELVRRIFAEDDDQMPPAATKNPLTPAEKEILKQWIAEGAEYKPH